MEMVISFAKFLRIQTLPKGSAKMKQKMMYVLKFDHSPYFKESLKNDFNSKTFCFKFDETTSNQIKK